MDPPSTAPSTPQSKPSSASITPRTSPLTPTTTPSTPPSPRYSTYTTPPTSVPSTPATETTDTPPSTPSKPTTQSPGTPKPTPTTHRINIHPCLPCSTRSLSCSFTTASWPSQPRTTTTTTGTQPCTRCARAAHPARLCILQPQRMRTRTSSHPNKTTFTAADPAAADPGTVHETVVQLLERQKEALDRANWVLPGVDGRRVRARVDEEGKRF